MDEKICIIRRYVKRAFFNENQIRSRKKYRARENLGNEIKYWIAFMVLKQDDKKGSYHSLSYHLRIPNSLVNDIFQYFFIKSILAIKQKRNLSHLSKQAPLIIVLTLLRSSTSLYLNLTIVLIE